jgi:small-conductance mechanosensitive channel
MIVKKIIQFITLESAAVSTHRKRQLVMSTVLLGLLLCLRVLNLAAEYNTPYATDILEVLLYAVGTNIILNILRILIVSGHRKRRNIPNDDHDNFTVGINAIVNALTVLATVVFIFIVFQIEFKSFLSSVALFAVALTVIFQDFIKNFLFGFAIMFSADYVIGDYIQVGSVAKGVVLTITFSNVQLKTESGDILYIPNTVVRSCEVTNFSRLKPKRINTEFRLLRTQVTSVDVFEKKLLAYLDTTYPNIFEIEKCKVYVREGNKDEVVFSFEAPTKKASLKLKEKINHSVQKFSVEYRE